MTKTICDKEQFEKFYGVEVFSPSNTTSMAPRTAPAVGVAGEGGRTGRGEFVYILVVLSCHDTVAVSVWPWRDSVACVSSTFTALMCEL